VTAYACVICHLPTEKGSIMVMGDRSVIVALCPTHQKRLRDRMKAEGVPVHSAEKMN
jgi:hypothetical protein